MILKFSHVSLSTKSLKKVENFYVKKLKFKIVHKFINKNTGQLYGYFIQIDKNNFLEFFLSKEKFNLNLNKPLRHMCFDVKNIYKFKKIFRKKIKVKRGKTDNILQFYVKDNEGNLIEFHQKNKKMKFKK